MTPNEKKFYDDLVKNGKTKSWTAYSKQYFGKQADGGDTARRAARRLGVAVKEAVKAPHKKIVVKDRSQGEMTPQEKAYLERIKKDGIYGTNAQMTQDYNPGCNNPDWSADVRRKYNFVVEPKKQTPQTKIEDRRQQEQMQELREQNKELSNQVVAMERALEKYANIQNYDPKKINIPEPSNKRAHEATAIIQWSDWHIEERIISSTVNGMNSFDLSIAKKRATNLFENGLKLINTQRSSVDIKELVLHLGGDFITGYIHPEGEQTNQLSPLNACQFAIDLLISGIEYKLKYGDFDRIRIVCSRGNHGRTTMKKQSNDYEMNNEIFIYYFLQKYFKDEKRVIFLVDESEFSYMDIYGRTVRFFHGDQVKFKGGIGGMTVPMYKLILRLDANRPAYWNLMGDKHTYSTPVPNVSVNGSLCGFNTYAARLGLKFEEPVQSFLLMDARRGMTIKAPIFVQ